MIDLTVARRYAKALLTLGKEDGKYKEYGEGISGSPIFCSGSRNCGTRFSIRSTAGRTAANYSSG